jgi:hypothetical protein
MGSSEIFLLFLLSGTAGGVWGSDGSADGSAGSAGSASEAELERRVNIIYEIVFTALAIGAVFASLVLCYCRFRNSCVRRKTPQGEEHIDYVTKTTFGIGLMVPSPEATDAVVHRYHTSPLLKWCCGRRSADLESGPGPVAHYVEGNLALT